MSDVPSSDSTKTITYSETSTSRDTYTHTNIISKANNTFLAQDGNDNHPTNESGGRGRGVGFMLTLGFAIVTRGDPYSYARS